MAETQTTVSTKEVSFDDLVNSGASAANVMLPANKEKTAAPGMFKREVGPTFIESTTEDDSADDSSEEGTQQQGNTNAAAEDQEEDQENDSQEGDDADVLNLNPSNQGNENEEKRVNKTAMVSELQKLVDAKIIQPFEGDKLLKDYTMSEISDLIKANLEERENRVREEFPAEFFSSLPEEMQTVVEYLSKGGTNFKSLFRALAGVEEVKELDPKNSSHQEAIIRQYLRATQFGSEEEIGEEIEGWRDRGELEAKALKFKPKLDKMQKEHVDAQLQRQEEVKNQRAAAARNYASNIYSVLEKGELNGVKLDGKTQNMLYAGLVQPNYPSINGHQTNMLGHLLEKYQFTKEANHSIVAECLWLLADPEGYRSKIRESGASAANSKTAKLLKTAEQSSNKGMGGNQDEDNTNTRKKAGLKRPNPGQSFFRPLNK